jgi:HD superfamily phosphohydrolase YqeK
MSAAALIEAAAGGQLPAWARLGERRRAHVARVVELLDRWAVDLGLGPAERVRWRAAGWLHDSLRDANAEELRAELGQQPLDLPTAMLHGPAAAARLAREGVHDQSLLLAVAHHTTGHPSLDRLGCALYLADYLEPGRTFAPDWTAALRARLPQELDAVLPTVIAARIGHTLERRRPLQPQTLAFWNAVVAES